MLFEETVPAGRKSWFHLHHGSDEVAYVLNGEVTFNIGDEVTVGGPGKRERWAPWRERVVRRGAV